LQEENESKTESKDEPEEEELLQEGWESTPEG